MEFADRVSIEKRGRSGDVVVHLPGETLRFYWEFGGGRCIAIVNVPGEEEWVADQSLRRHPRAGFLASLAKEIARRECPDAEIEITGNAIGFYERAPASGDSRP